MSVSLVNEHDIHYLIGAGLHLGEARREPSGVPRLHWYVGDAGYELTHTTATAIGQALVDENFTSVQHRHPYWEELRDGPMVYEYRPVHRSLFYFHLAVQVVKSASWYEFQSNQHEGWAGSVAQKYIETLKGAAERHLVGYAEAVWGVPRSVLDFQIPEDAHVVD